MDFAFTEEQELLRRSVREFAEAEIGPHVMKFDEAQEFPPPVAGCGRYYGVLFGVLRARGWGMSVRHGRRRASRVDGSIGISVAALNSLLRITSRLRRRRAEKEVRAEARLGEGSAPEPDRADGV